MASTETAYLEEVPSRSQYVLMKELVAVELPTSIRNRDQDTVGLSLEMLGDALEGRRPWNMKL